MKTTNEKANYHFAKRAAGNKGIKPTHCGITPGGFSRGHFEISFMLMSIGIIANGRIKIRKCDMSYFIS